MQPKKSLLAVVMVILVSLMGACAGVPLFSGAGHEFDLGLAKFNAGKYEEAIPHFTKATELDTEYAKAYLYLGRCYLSLQRWTEAVTPLRTAYRLSPTETRKEALELLFDALMGAAGREFKLGNFRNSISYLKEGLTLAPGSEKAKTELVRSLMAQGGKFLSEGNIQEALSLYREVLDWFPNHFDAYLGMAKAYFKSADYSKAIEAAKKALGIHPGSEEAMALIRQLLLKK